MSSAVPLDRLLSRLDQTLLSSTPETDHRLQTSQYERNRVGANIEHARAMLLTFEKQSATIRAHPQKSQIQADLQAKRELIKRLNTRLRELNDAGEKERDDDSDDEEGEDILHSYAPARKELNDGLDSGEPQASRVDESAKQELRARRPLQASDNLTAASTSAREQLFGGKTADHETKETEVLMSHNRTEQEALTTGLLGLARALKESSLNFSSSLEEEKAVLARAEGGLDKSAQGMDAAGQKMSMLRKMSEGQGWWGRIKLYAFIFGLWVACFLIVFVGPKLRF
ncbi:hypothetical protein TI39_contig562g00013 [Zymoseptoria brevis]|uniref:Uncharacterized protein n=1 Tax=Zymoseptoria brevis TaxID=1047168 RepID=A0A0F4GJ34_9PEZI|nr:hypothetical protein TI39_contig562g00013 [Zymoseptoria brevis]